MRSRCYRKKDKCFHLYGGRGITVCDRWLNDYDAFFEDMGQKPTGLSLDRIDSNGNYEPGNCRWVNMRIQQQNRRNNINLNLNQESHTISEWARIKGLHRTTISNRLKKGLNIEDCVQSSRSNEVSHGTNHMYSKLQCRCNECKEFNRKKSQQARDSLKLKRMNINASGKGQMVQ